MSANMVGKLDIDAIVQTALLGPSELATGWVPMVSEPDAFGRELWDRNWFVTEGSHAGETMAEAAANIVAGGGYDEIGMAERPEPYVFTPLPFLLTGSEALRSCEFYGYQTYCDVDSGDPWDAHPELAPLGQTPAGRVYEELRGRLASQFAGEGPWGWEPADITARADRPAPIIPPDLLS